MGLDTAPLIYFLEEHPTYLPRVDPFFDALDQGHLRVATSSVSLIEVLTQPLRQGNAALADRYGKILPITEGLTVLPVSARMAEEAARLRAAHGLRTPDAIQVAAALQAGATSFLTNDTQLARPPASTC